MGAEDPDATPGLAGYSQRSYGDAFADVYDAWYEQSLPTDATVAFLATLAGSEPILELGVGTGRVALPLAAAVAPTQVWGLDSSPAMLAALAAKDPDRQITLVEADMADTLPQQDFSLIFAAYNTLFNLDSEVGQRRCFRHVAQRLISGGHFVIDVFVPNETLPTREDVAIRSITATTLVLSATRHLADQQRVVGQFVEMTNDAPVRLRPWQVRYATVEQLDAMAQAAGLVLAHRWSDVERAPFDSTSPRHVSVYRRL